MRHSDSLLILLTLPQRIFQLEGSLEHNLVRVCSAPQALVAERHALLSLWSSLAVNPQESSLNELAALPHPHVRRPLRSSPDGVQPVLGQFLHVALWRELANVGHYEDQRLIEEIVEGMPIVGEILRSGRWPALPVAEDGPSVWQSCSIGPGKFERK